MVVEKPEHCPLCLYGGNPRGPQEEVLGDGRWCIKHENTLTYAGGGVWSFIVTCIDCEEDITVKFSTKTVIDLTEDDS